MPHTCCELEHVQRGTAGWRPNGRLAGVAGIVDAQDVEGARADASGGNLRLAALAVLVVSRRGASVQARLRTLGIGTAVLDIGL